MRRFIVALILSLLLHSMTSVAGFADTAAALPVLPAKTAYPAWLTVKNHHAISNAKMDCAWNFDCGSGQALFHQAAQEDLGRVSGWLQIAQWNDNSAASIILVWGSTYAPDTAANGGEAASLDYGNTVSSEAFHAATCPAFSLPASQVQCFKARGDGTAGNPTDDRYWTITWWDGTAEVEAAAYTNNRYTQVRTAFYAIVAATMAAPDAGQ